MVAQPTRGAPIGELLLCDGEVPVGTGLREGYMTRGHSSKCRPCLSTLLSPPPPPSAGQPATSWLPTFSAGPSGPPDTIAVADAGAGKTVPTAADGNPPEVDASIPGLALIPPKLVQKILRGEFVDMHELLPDTWRVEEQQESCCRSTRPKGGWLRI